MPERSSRKWLSYKSSGIGCRYFPPGPRLSSQLYSITDSCPIPNYTAWWERHKGVSSLPKAATRWCPVRTRTATCESQAMPVMPPRHLRNQSKSIPSLPKQYYSYHYQVTYFTNARNYMSTVTLKTTGAWVSSRDCDVYAHRSATHVWRSSAMLITTVTKIYEASLSEAATTQITNLLPACVECLKGVPEIDGNM